MGTIASRDTRRISFNNTMALQSNVSNIQKCAAVEDDIMAIDSLEDKNVDIEMKECNELAQSRDDEQDYWTYRIETLRSEHQTINKIMECEYEKTFHSVNQIFDTPKVNTDGLQKMKPCFDWHAKILRCYEENPHQPLMCSAVVQAFSDCVSSYKMQE